MSLRAYAYGCAGVCADVDADVDASVDAGVVAVEARHGVGDMRRSLAFCAATAMRKVSEMRSVVPEATTPC